MLDDANLLERAASAIKAAVLAWHRGPTGHVDLAVRTLHMTAMGLVSIGVSRHASVRFDDSTQLLDAVRGPDGLVWRRHSTNQEALQASVFKRALNELWSLQQGDSQATRDRLRDVASDMMDLSRSMTLPPVTAPETVGIRQPEESRGVSTEHRKGIQVREVVDAGCSVKWIRADDASRHSQLNADTIRKAAKRGKWNTKRSGRMHCYDLCDLENQWPNRTFIPDASGK
jgi:hypothetical protein